MLLEPYAIRADRGEAAIDLHTDEPLNGATRKVTKCQQSP